MPMNSLASCWVVTDGKIGMENQCLGLASALGLAPSVKRVKLRFPWTALAPYLKVGLKSAFSPQSDAIAPPWPDLLIATGRQSIPASLLARKASGGKTLTVQLQDPVIAPANFDLVVVPQHDGLRGPNVVVTKGALHRVTPEVLKAEAEKFASTFSNFKAPLIAVLIGGTNAVYQLTPAEMTPLAKQLAKLAKTTGGSLLITPSRRTGDENIAILKKALRNMPSYIWDGEGENPYFALLALADYILPTCDSVNMVTEACSTGKPVLVIDLPGGSDKFRRFHDMMRQEDFTRDFEGKLENYSYKPLDDMAMVAARVKHAMAQRGF